MIREHGLAYAIGRWMTEHPFHPRAAPYFVYLLFLFAIPFARDWQPATYPVLYALQCVVVAAMLWTYRGMTPELTFRFHWLAVVVGVGVFFAWLALGLASREILDRHGGSEPATHFFATADPVIVRFSLVLRVVGMTLLVPPMEELFVRSLLPRCLHSAKRSWWGIVQLAQDLPIVGERILASATGDRLAKEPPIFRAQFEATPLGRVSVFGALASTVIFAMAHQPADYLGCVVCGLAYCALVAATNRSNSPGNDADPARQKGLGPAIWAHGITNLLIFVYSVTTGDWRLM